MQLVKTASSLLAAIALTGFLNTKNGPLPPVGNFLDPFHGFWRNAETEDAESSETLTLPGLCDSVTILYDDRQVPHVFAKNDHDLYLAQGYVTARDRLWQMEFQTHAAAGRLSEIMGRVSLGSFTTVDYDLQQRRVGMTYGARNALKNMQADSVVSQVVAAYTEGVNAYIQTLKPAGYPVEYKILDYAPEPWTPFKCALFLEHMAWMLTGRSTELQMSNTLARFGEDVVADLFPTFPKHLDPVIPRGTKWPFKPVTVVKPTREFTPAVSGGKLATQPNAANGSNNWAVSGKKTASGLPILANDPHLTLSLPSVWYEIQLVAPGVNTYGVSLPGAPNVIIGFNDKIAWGETNSEADVMDWYEIKFKDGRLNEYWYDNAWRPTSRYVEKIKIRGEATLLDTVVFTHHGPVVLKPGEKSTSRQVPVLHALRWLGHRSSDEARTFYELNRAQNYDDYVAALEYYDCPAQNFVYADRDDNIAIWHNGRFPARWKNQGKTISDGSDPAYDWQAWIPREQNPHVKNPARGFVSSANQNPTDESYPYYLNWWFAPYYRGARINEWLSTTDNIRPDDFRVMQLDTKNLHAESALPLMLRGLRRGELDSAETALLSRLEHWDFFDDANKIAPTIFKVWWDSFYHSVWDDDFGGGYLRLPEKDRTVQLLQEEPQSKWFDNRATSTTETSAELLLSSFKAACARLMSELGPPGAAWHWARYKGTEIRHVARIPGLGRRNLDVGGDFGIVNATAKTHGPSWRMVVALGPQVEAWGIYPGGQSGNPGSPHYDDFIDDWASGELAELLYLKSKDDVSERITKRMELRK